MTIHYNQNIPWHVERLPAFEKGLNALGILPFVTQSQLRKNDNPAILFGTSLFGEIEKASGRWLLVDRACFLDPTYVRLGWNGRGTLADYRVSDPTDSSRWDSFGFDIEPKDGERIVLCGDYNSIPEHPHLRATHFRPHPACKEWNPTGLPIVQNFRDAGMVIVGSSTVAFEAILDGRKVMPTCDTLALRPLSYIAQTQWSWKEIANGKPIAHLFN